MGSTQSKHEFTWDELGEFMDNDVNIMLDEPYFMCGGIGYDHENMFPYIDLKFTASGTNMSEPEVLHHARCKYPALFNAFKDSRQLNIRFTTIEDFAINPNPSGFELR